MMEPTASTSATAPGKPPKVALACQGGGAHTAFTAGVLRRILADRSIEIRALSGTSGGAVCAVIAWSELVAAAREPDPADYNRRLRAFWDENTTPLLQVLPWAAAMAGMRLAGELGFTVETSAYRIPLDGHRMFLDLIEKHVPFDRLTPDQLTTTDPRLLISAADVRTGEFRVFRSHRVNELGPDLIGSRTVLASAALPMIFRAVPLCGGLYWDGGFTQNPPTRELIDAARCDDTSAESEEIELWVIQINPQRRDSEPTSMDDIRDRRNELLENISFQQEIFFISKINEFVAKKPPMLSPAGLKKYRSVKVRGITMAHDVAETLDYESKIERNSAFIDRMFTHGEERAEEFLRLWAAADADVTTTLPDRDIWGRWTRSSSPCLDAS